MFLLKNNSRKNESLFLIFLSFQIIENENRYIISYDSTENNVK
jgi:hypothetical protein